MKDKVKTVKVVHDQIGNELKPGDMLYWHSMKLLVEVVSVDLGGKELYGGVLSPGGLTLKLTLPFKNDGKSESVSFTDFITVVQPPDVLAEKEARKENRHGLQPVG